MSMGKKIADAIGKKMEEGDKTPIKVDQKIKNKDDYYKEYGKDEVLASRDQMMEVDFPKTSKRYIITYDSFSSSIEAAYFWVYNYMKYDMGYFRFEKITDLFSASEGSAFFGSIQQKLGIQQDKISGFLATIGKLIKDMFQMVRELRFIDERLGYYEKSMSHVRSVAEPAEITLKGIYIDMAEGATKNPASVYGLAKELQFTTLPDLFFSVTAQSSDEIGGKVDALDFNVPLKNVLKRKLFAFMRWKEETHKEIYNRRIFMLKYLRQHFNIIKMYIAWVKPYLRNINRLTMDASRTEGVDLIAAFESSAVEIEFLAINIPEGNKHFLSCVVANFYQRTMPQMNYNAEGYQRGPIHVGEVTWSVRGYTWTEEDIKKYKRMRELENFELIGSIDESLKAAMDALGDELVRYLEEAGEPLEKKDELKKPQKPKQTIFEPFSAIFKGLKEVADPFVPKRGSAKPKQSYTKFAAEKEKSKAAAYNSKRMWLIYKNYKKAHRLLTW